MRKRKKRRRERTTRRRLAIRTYHLRVDKIAI